MKTPIRSIIFLVFIVCIISACAQGKKKVQFTSAPPGASVFLNDEPIGVTPFQSEIKDREGDYSIYIFEAVLDDKIPDRRSFKEETYQDTVDTVLPDKINFVLPEPIGGTTYIWSLPPGAEITLNGKKLGKTPLRVSIQEILGEQKKETARIIANLKGHKKTEQKITLDPKKEQGNIPLSLKIKMIPWSW